MGEKFRGSLDFVQMKTFTVFTSTVWKVLKKAIAELNIRHETFIIHHKSVKATVLFSCLTFVVYIIILAIYVVRLLVIYVI